MTIFDFVTSSTNGMMAFHRIEKTAGAPTIQNFCILSG